MYIICNYTLLYMYIVYNMLHNNMIMHASEIILQNTCSVSFGIIPVDCYYYLYVRILYVERYMYCVMHIYC